MHWRKWGARLVRVEMVEITWRDPVELIREDDVRWPLVMALMSPGVEAVVGDFDMATGELIDTHVYQKPPKP